jgi:Asp-tRNA(Asn)/Glu-tRNA(Gln) amidotransferase A subunit family amidase
MKIQYDPASSKLLTFYDKIPAFLDGSDTPRAYLERCLETIAEREPDVKAFVTFSLDRARTAADEATARYKDKRPLGPLDGMPFAMKDVFETEDMPMQLGSPLFEGYETGWDAACVYFLRRGGAVMVGKTVTTEFAFGNPGPARNAWDSDRTPGGSSSGSGAAVGASMVPAATGTQVRGSILRPACYNGAWALKPSWGAINTRGGFPSPPSIGHLGFLAGSLADTWISCYWLSQNAGGDAGHPSLKGEAKLPEAVKPARLARVDTAGWADTPEDTREIFNQMIAKLERRGVEVVSRREDPDLEAYEQDMIKLNEVIQVILAYEYRWPLMMYADRAPEKLGERVFNRAKAAAELTPDQYEEALEWSIGARARHEAFSTKYDAFLTLNGTGPAPEGMPVGNAVYGEQSSVLGVPTLNAPLLAQDGMPLGIQVLGYFRRDYELIALGHWMIHAVLREED